MTVISGRTVPCFDGLSDFLETLCALHQVGLGPARGAGTILRLTGDLSADARSNVDTVQHIQRPSVENGFYSKTEFRRAGRAPLLAEMVRPVTTNGALARLGAVDRRICAKDQSAPQDDMRLGSELTLSDMYELSLAAERRIADASDRRSIRIHLFGGGTAGEAVGLWGAVHRDMPRTSHLVALRTWIKARATGRVLAFAELTVRVP